MRKGARYEGVRGALLRRCCVVVARVCVRAIMLPEPSICVLDGQFLLCLGCGGVVKPKFQDDDVARLAQRILADVAPSSGRSIYRHVMSLSEERVEEHLPQLQKELSSSSPIQQYQQYHSSGDAHDPRLRSLRLCQLPYALLERFHGNMNDEDSHVSPSKFGDAATFAFPSHSRALLAWYMQWRDNRADSKAVLRYLSCAMDRPRLRQGVTPHPRDKLLPTPSEIIETLGDPLGVSSWMTSLPWHRLIMAVKDGFNVPVNAAYRLPVVLSFDADADDPLQRPQFAPALIFPRAWRICDSPGYLCLRPLVADPPLRLEFRRKLNAVYLVFPKADSECPWWLEEHERRAVREWLPTHSVEENQGTSWRLSKPPLSLKSPVFVEQDGCKSLLHIKRPREWYEAADPKLVEDKKERSTLETWKKSAKRCEGDDLIVGKMLMLDEKDDDIKGATLVASRVRADLFNHPSATLLKQSFGEEFCNGLLQAATDFKELKMYLFAVRSKTDSDDASPVATFMCMLFHCTYVNGEDGEILFIDALTVDKDIREKGLGSETFEICRTMMERRTRTTHQRYKRYTILLQQLPANEPAKFWKDKADPTSEARAAMLQLHLAYPELKVLTNCNCTSRIRHYYSWTLP